MIVVEMNIFKTQVPLYLLIGVVRGVQIFLQGKVFAYMPVFLDKYILNHIPDANICTYDDAYLNNGLVYLGFVY